jgi:hypothetical protein
MGIPNGMAGQKGRWIDDDCRHRFVTNYTWRYNRNAYNMSQRLLKV